MSKGGGGEEIQRSEVGGQRVDCWLFVIGYQNHSPHPNPLTLRGSRPAASKPHFMGRGGNKALLHRMDSLASFKG